MTKIPSYVTTFDAIIGSCSLSYPWWQVDDSPADWLNPEPGWRVVLSELDPDEDEATGKTIVVTHKSIMKAITKIANGGATYIPKGMSLRVVDECEKFLRDRDEADFDSDLADQILQYMMFGEVVYG